MLVTNPKLLFILISLIVSSIFPNNKEKLNKTVNSFKLETPLLLDGILNENIYQNPPITNFTQKDPDEGKPSTEKTEVWISYDEANIYFSAKFYDSQPDSIDVSLMRRDNMSESDWFWIYLDPYNDNRTGNYFAVNAGGSICDGTLYNDGWMDDSWDGIWEVKTNVDESGWSTEIRIPFGQLRFNEAAEMVWGINLNRDIKRKHEMSFLVMVPKDESGFISRFADLTGLNGVKPKQRLEILPYIVQKAQFLRDSEDDPFYKGNQFQTSFGADLKFGIGSNLNVDATINPDFGQVEVDPAVVNLSAFESFFDEKRPFFIEGANIFQFGNGGANNNWGFNFGTPTLFYSRRIGRTPQGEATTEGDEDFPNETRILGAGKLTGKINDTWSVGVLSAITEKTYARISTEQDGIVKNEVEPFTHYGVFRTRKEFDEGNKAIGFMFTSVNRDLSNPNLKDLLTDQAYTYGLDGWSFLDENKMYVLTGSVVGSYVHGSKEAMVRVQEMPYRYFQRPDKTYMPIDSNRTSLSGTYARVMLNKQEGNFYLNAALGAATPGFEFNDLGFQWFADRINGHIVTGYRWYEPDKTFRQKSIYLAFNRNSDFEDNISRMGFYSTGNLQFLNYWRIGFNGSYDFEATSVTKTRGGPKVMVPYDYSFSISADSDSREKIIASPYAGYWGNGLGSYDYYYGFDIEWKPKSQITISIGPEYNFTNANYQWVGAFADENADHTFGSRYVFGEMEQNTFSANIRINWSFSPKLSLQLYLQPLFSVGDYNTFKELAEPNSYNYDIYGENGSAISYDEEDETYTVTPDNTNPDESFSFDNPNFNFKSLRGNAVLRWEFKPGSVFYFVWTHDKVNFHNPGEFAIGKDFTNLWNSDANNIFLVKFSYWFDI